MSRSSSPDSSLSISSLLASCSLSRSGSSSRSSAAVTYKDRLYDSASKALEAYIRDYEEGLQSPLQTGKISLGGSARARPPAAKRANPRLKTKQTSSRRRPARDVELLSLTTDDLLSYPSDGSLPVSSSSQSEQGRRRPVRRPRVSPTRRQAPLASSLNWAPRLNLRDLQPREFPESLRKHCWKSRSSRHGEDSENQPVLNDCTASSCLPQGSGLSKSYPRWMTSQKSELSVSGLTSVPDVRYPVWLKSHGLLSDSDSDAISASYLLRNHSLPKNAESCRGLSTGASSSLQVPLNDSYQEPEGRNVPGRTL
uniref:Uncharacterized protein n=1 Tax=Leptobrachium leishanense TaxID=445787 RepID=A0A8C5QIS2_9ANUR